MYSAPAGATVDQGMIVYRNGARRQMNRCTHPTLAYHPASAAPRPIAAPAVSPGLTSWLAVAFYPAPTWETYLSERFSVPANPSTSGAVIYYFPSLTDPHNSTILQPVLTWGANGIVSNPNIWFITSWYVWNNNSNYVHSTNSVHVGPGDTIDGSIATTSCNGNGTCTWTVDTCVEGGNCATPLTVVSGVPFSYAEAGVMEVGNDIASCAQMPANGHEAFRNLVLTTHDGFVTPNFTIEYPVASNCGVSETASSTGADIFWTP